MNNDSSTNDRQWLQYIEILRFESRPVKIEIVLQERIKTLLKARAATLNDAKLEE